MKFKYVKEVEKPVRNYLGNWISTGEIIDLPDHLALKAQRNPNYEEIVEVAVKQKVEEVTDGNKGGIKKPSLRVPGTQDSGTRSTNQG